jgi:hypothetical protein
MPKPLFVGSSPSHEEEGYGGEVLGISKDYEEHKRMRKRKHCEDLEARDNMTKCRTAKMALRER